MAANESLGVTTRPATVSDEEFLWEVQRRALGPYLWAQFGTTPEQQREFFDRHFDLGEHLVVERDGEPIGFLFSEHRGDSVYLGNLALMPEHQGRGIGAMLVGSVVRDAAQDGLPVTLQVLKSNQAARRFYERLGFVAAGETNSHVKMNRAVQRGEA